MKVIDEVTTTFGVPDRILDVLSPKSREAVQRLLKHSSEPFDLSVYPQKKLAAVLVLLYEEADTKKLHVLLTTRSKALRSHPGQTALPGGKCDETDADIAFTAYREANEEVALPLPSSDSNAMTFNLTLLRPFMSKYHLVVTPLVALLNPAHLDVLSSLVPQAGEVERIFHHPLEALLDPSLVAEKKDAELAEKGGEDWPYEEEFYNSSDAQWAGFSYRMHRFRSAASPIKGLTSDILILAAQVAFDRQPSYELWAEGQPRTYAAMATYLQDYEAARARLGTGTAGEAVESKHSSREKLVSV